MDPCGPGKLSRLTVSKGYTEPPSLSTLAPLTAARSQFKLVEHNGRFRQRMRSSSTRASPMPGQNVMYSQMFRPGPYAKVTAVLRQIFLAFHIRAAHPA